jgi:hypothetical protein
MEEVVFPPVVPQHLGGACGRRDFEGMDVDADVDIEGEADGVRAYSSDASSSARLVVASSSSLPAASTTSLLPSISTSTASVSAIHISSSPFAPTSMPHASASFIPRSSASTSTTTATPKPKPKRLAGPGVPPPSPEAPPPEVRARWGPLIGVARGVRAVERVRGSGGWGGVMLEREREGGYEFWEGYAGGVYQGYAREMEGYGYGYAGDGQVGLGADAYGRVSVNASASRAYEVVERAGGWDVVHEGRGVRGWETEEDGDGDLDGDVDVVGDGDVGAFCFLSLSFSPSVPFPYVPQSSTFIPRP